MKAAIYTQYGPPEVLEVKEVIKPEPQAGEVLIKVHYATVNRTDTGMRSAQYFVSRLFSGLVNPKYTTPGSEFAGEIVQVGAEVTDYKVGDKVFGFDDTHGGACAEFVVKPVDRAFTIMPADYSYENAAASTEGATYALSVIRAAKVAKDQKVLVYGASGAIGSAAVQILNYIGAEVTAVCGTNAVEKIQGLKPDKLVDYQKQDFTNTDEKYDLIIDAVGKSSYGICKPLLAEKGMYCSSELGKGGENIFFALWFGITGTRKVIFPIPVIAKEKTQYIKQMIEAGAFKPLIDRTYPLDSIVEATQYVESGQKIGNVLIKVI